MKKGTRNKWLVPKNLAVLCLLAAFISFILLSLLNPDFVISILMRRSVHSESEILSYIQRLEKKELEIQSLKLALGSRSNVSMNYGMSSSTNTMLQSSRNRTSNIVSAIRQEIESASESFCENKYGLRLIDYWRDRGETWCGTNTGVLKSDLRPELKCYSYHQEHKKLDGRGPDMFCEATDFFIDFSKIRGHVLPTQSRGSESYLTFDRGSLFSSCQRRAAYNHRLFMPHHSRQMQSFESDHQDPPANSYTTVTQSTYLLARDEDCENTFHSTADFVILFLDYI